MARDAGFEFLIVTRVNQYKDLIENEGFELIPIRLKRRRTNVLKEVLSIIEIIQIYRR